MFIRALLLVALALRASSAQVGRPSLELGVAFGFAGGDQVLEHGSVQLRAGPRWESTHGLLLATEAEIGRRVWVGDCILIGVCKTGFNFIGGGVAVGWAPRSPRLARLFTVRAGAGAYRVSWAPDRLQHWEDQSHAGLGLSLAGNLNVWRGQAANLAITGRWLVFPHVGGARLWSLPVGVELGLPRI